MPGIHDVSVMVVAPSVVAPDILLHLPGQLLEVRSYTLSLHRAVVRADAPLPVGTELRVVFLNPSGPLSLKGTVRWVREGEMGVYFEALSPAQTADLQRVLRALGVSDQSGMVRAPG